VHTIDAQGFGIITSGVLRGTREEGVTVFRGVPYAQPPTGSLRFCAPRPPVAWSGVRDASRSGHASYQINFQNQSEIVKISAQIDPGVPGVIAGPKSVFKTYCHNDVSEDCLYLDIWVPDKALGQLVPVYVYYHGGANMVSSGSFALERAANLSREAGIIVVRPNYRLGALGWVHFGLIDCNLPEAVNLGLQDQFAALRWVHENIASFGGDPDNVTVGGESAGATAVSHILNNPDAYGYFRRAILQSFSPFNPWCTQQQDEAEFVAKKYLELLEITDPGDLRDIHPAKLVATQNLLARYFGPDAHVAWRSLGAVIDQNWVPQQPGKFLSELPIRKPELEVMIGFAKDEWQFFRGHTDTVQNGTEKSVIAILEQVFGGEVASSIYATFRGIHVGAAPGQILAQIMAFEYFKLPSLLAAKNLSEQGIPVHVFQFSYDLPGSGLLATHTGDMPFIFRNHSVRDLASWPFFEGVDVDQITLHQTKIARISEDFGALYSSFIHLGDPGSRWPRYGSSTREILSVGEKVGLKAGLLDSEMAAYESHEFANVSRLEEVLIRNVRQDL